MSSPLLPPSHEIAALADEAQALRAAAFALVRDADHVQRYQLIADSAHLRARLVAVQAQRLADFQRAHEAETTLLGAVQRLQSLPHPRVASSPREHVIPTALAEAWLRCALEEGYLPTTRSAA